MNFKIKTEQEITNISDALRKQNKKIAVYNGSFDIIHAGHIKSIREAKSVGDIIIILLNSDKSISSYKGPRHPLNPESERAELLASINYVDYVVLFDDITPNRLLEKIKPHFFCQGADWGMNCIERKTIEENGGKIHILKWQNGMSTSNLIKKIIEVYSVSEPKAIFLNNCELPPEAAVLLSNLSERGYNIIKNKIEKFSLLDSSKEMQLNLNKSWIISDKEEEILLGRELNINTVKIGSELSPSLKIGPSFYAKDIPNALKIISGEIK